MAGRWRAWFTRDRTYDSLAYEPKHLPDDGCLIVVQLTGLETPKRHTYSGEDTYFWWEGPEGLVIGCNSDCRAENERRYPGAVFVRGKWTTHQRMAYARQAAQEWRPWQDGS